MHSSEAVLAPSQVWKKGEAPVKCSKVTIDVIALSNVGEADHMDQAEQG